MSGKPKGVVYKGRIERYPDETWLIWSNKWGCWYRPKSQGYTDDLLQAGLFDREKAAQHMEPLTAPRSHRDTEPFPISAVAKHIRQRRAEFEDRVAKERAALDLLESHILRENSHV